MQIWHIYTAEYLAIKKNETIKFTGKWREIETIILRMVTQNQNVKCHMFFSHLWMLASDMCVSFKTLTNVKYWTPDYCVSSHDAISQNKSNE